jgi:hypothetical protein
LGFGHIDFNAKTNKSGRQDEQHLLRPVLVWLAFSMSFVFRTLALHKKKSVVAAGKKGGKIKKTRQDMKSKGRSWTPPSFTKSRSKRCRSSRVLFGYGILALSLLECMYGEDFNIAQPPLTHNE